MYADECLVIAWRLAPRFCKDGRWNALGASERVTLVRIKEEYLKQVDFVDCCFEVNIKEK